MIYIWVSKEAENNTIFWKVFKKLYKTIKESISIDVANHFYSKGTRRTLKGHLSTQRALQGHSKGTLKAFQGHSEGTWALKALRRSNIWDTWGLKEHLDIWALKVLVHLGTWGTRAIEGYLCTWALMTLGT